MVRHSHFLFDLPLFTVITFCSIILESHQVRFYTTIDYHPIMTSLPYYLIMYLLNPSKHNLHLLLSLHLFVICLIFIGLNANRNDSNSKNITRCTFKVREETTISFVYLGSFITTVLDEPRVILVYPSR